MAGRGTMPAVRSSSSSGTLCCLGSAAAFGAMGLLGKLALHVPGDRAVAAAVLGRERLDARRATALVLASGGLVLVLAGAGTGAVDRFGAALGAAVVYTYILVMSTVEPLVAALLALLAF